MLRSGAPRSLWRSLNAKPTPAVQVTLRPAFRSQLYTSFSRRPEVCAKPLASKTLALTRWQSTTGRGPVDSINEKVEEKLSHKTLKVTPDTVSSTSTMSPVLDPTKSDEDDTQMLAGIKSDLQTIRDTFSLKDVPHQAYFVGMAGVIPYAVTSVSTIFCAWEIKQAAATGSGYLLQDKTAELLLHIIEPLQVGYGAVIISFLGAIHWGLEWAAYGGTQGYPRYAIGVLSTAAAWPTLLMPVEYALISQFLIFNFLYYSDSNAARRGWCPPWYGVYRFVLTFIVGASIVMSLIGRGQIAGEVGRPSGPADRIREFREHQQGSEWEDEVASRRKYLGDEKKDDDEEEEEEDDE